MGDPAWGVDVTWHGHSCFTLKDSLGRTVAIDPFDETVGYGWLRLKADVVLVTHAHFDHNNTRAVKSRLQAIDLVDSTGTVNVASGFTVSGIPSFHDAEGGQIHGPNRIYTFVLGGLRFAHFGDFGQTRLTDEQKRAIGHVDVLFVPVGGVTTVDARGAWQIVGQLRPSVVFPMHYGNIRFYKLDEVSLFTRLFPANRVLALEDDTVRLRRTDLPEAPVVYTLKSKERNL
jgi:L-ascorbate metabolism protein UlaG (beta-lactamase superfamily)